MIQKTAPAAEQPKTIPVPVELWDTIHSELVFLTEFRDMGKQFPAAINQAMDLLELVEDLEEAAGFAWTRTVTRERLPAWTEDSDK